IVDFATLTGAARVALVPDMPPFFTDDDALAAELMAAAAEEYDPLWRLPLWRPYDKMLESKVADLNNVGAGGQARPAGRRRLPIGARALCHAQQALRLKMMRERSKIIGSFPRKRESSTYGNPRSVLRSIPACAGMTGLT